MQENLEKDSLLLPDLEEYRQDVPLTAEQQARYQRRQQKKLKIQGMKTEESRKARLKKLKAKHRKRMERKLEGLSHLQIQQRKKLNEERKKKERENAQRGQRQGIAVVIDCSFTDTMNSFQRRSLVQQIRLTYVHMRTAAKPARVIVCGLTEEYQLAMEKLSIRQMPLELVEGPPAKLFPQRELVYLSPDAEEVLPEVHPDWVYVVGGLVDRSILKEASLLRARQLGVRSFKLPIEKYIGFKRCLNVDTVAHLLVEFQACGNWELAVQKCVPAKNKRGKEEVNHSSAAEDHSAEHQDSDESQEDEPAPKGKSGG